MTLTTLSASPAAYYDIRGSHIYDVRLTEIAQRSLNGVSVRVCRISHLSHRCSFNYSLQIFWIPQELRIKRLYRKYCQRPKNTIFHENVPLNIFQSRLGAYWYELFIFMIKIIAQYMMLIWILKIRRTKKGASPFCFAGF